MKRTAIALALVVLGLMSLAMVNTAEATLLYYEGFEYDPGPATNPPTPWNRSFFGGSQSATIEAGSLAYPGLASAGNRLAQNDPVGGTLSYAVNNTASINQMFSSAGTYYITFLANVLRYQGDLDSLGGPTFEALSTGGKYVRPVIRGMSPGMARIELENWPGNVERVSASFATNDQPVLVAVRVVNDGGAGGDDVRVVVNPDLSLGEPDWDNFLLQRTADNITDAVASSGRITMNRANDFDEIRVATTWAEVAVPEPASLGLLGLAGLLLLGRRR